MARRSFPQLRRSRLWLACGLLLLPLPTTARSRPEAPTPNYVQAISIHGLLHWKRMPVSVYFTPGEASTRQRRDRARAGFDEWVQATGGFIAYRVVDAPSQTDITVTFDEAPFLVAQTHQTGNTGLTFYGKTLKRAEIELAAGGDTTPNQLQELAAHEFGHALGIDGHSDDPDDLMAPVELRVFDAYGAPVDAPPHPVTRRDLNTLRACYNVPMAAPAPPRVEASRDPDPDSETVTPAY